jgi:hypothetical protein
MDLQTVLQQQNLLSLLMESLRDSQELDAKTGTKSDATQGILAAATKTRDDLANMLKEIIQPD